MLPCVQKVCGSSECLARLFLLAELTSKAIPFGRKTVLIISVLLWHSLEIFLLNIITTLNFTMKFVFVDVVWWEVVAFQRSSCGSALWWHLLLLVSVMLYFIENKILPFFWCLVNGSWAWRKQEECFFLSWGRGSSLSVSDLCRYTAFHSSA